MQENDTSVQQELLIKYQQTDRYLYKITFFNAFLAFLLGIAYENVVAALVGGSMLFFSYLGMMQLKGVNRLVKTYIMATLFGLWSLLFIYLTNGLVESRFFYFGFIFLLVLYLQPGISYLNLGLTLLAEVSMYLPHLLNLPAARFMQLHFLQSRDANWEKFGITVLATFAVCTLLYFMALKLRRTTINGIKQHLKSQEQSELLAANTRLAKKIADGNLEPDASDIYNDDSFSIALGEMRKSLREAFQKENRDRFISSGLAESADLIRLESNNLNKLCHIIIKYLCEYLKANQGAIFIVQQENEETILALQAAYAYGKQRHRKSTVKPGEGLLGQVYIEKGPLYLDKLPEDYPQITSGLGKATPNYLYIVPVKQAEKVVGVIEMASFRELDPHERLFLEKVSEGVATAILSAQTAERTQSLLEESQMITEQMYAQEEEMRQNMEELQATQEEMQRKQKETERINRELVANEKKMNELLEETREREELLSLQNEQMQAQETQMQFLVEKIEEEKEELEKTKETERAKARKLLASQRQRVIASMRESEELEERLQKEINSLKGKISQLEEQLNHTR